MLCFHINQHPPSPNETSAACGQSWSKGTLNNSVVVVGGSLRIAAGGVGGFLGGHVVLTAGEAEIRDGLGEGTWGVGGAPGV